MDEDFKKRFLVDSEHTGRFVVTSLVTGKKYFVECIENSSRPASWGDINPSTKKLEGDYGNKYRGGIKADESMISKENGFDKIHDIPVGTSINDYIDRVDKEYQKQMTNG
jgi:hypothetical protein